MATKNNGITRADAIAFAIKACEGNAEVVDVLTKMHAQLTKPRAKAVSKARKANETLAAKVRDAISAKGDGMSTKDIVALGLPEITTTQRRLLLLAWLWSWVTSTSAWMVRPSPTLSRR